MLDDKELEHLLARCALRDQKAFARLYQMTAGYMNAVALRIVGSSDASSDVLQESFVKIWDNASTYSAAESRPLTWMASIVRYRAIDFLRREKRHQNRPSAEVEEDLLNRASSGVSQEDIQLQFGMKKKLADCMGKLGDKFRTSVDLAYFQGYSREDIAQLLGANVNTVKSWLHRGASSLKDCMQDKQESCHE